MVYLIIAAIVLVSIGIYVYSLNNQNNFTKPIDVSGASNYAKAAYLGIPLLLLLGYFVYSIVDSSASFSRALVPLAVVPVVVLLAFYRNKRK